VRPQVTEEERAASRAESLRETPFFQELEAQHRRWLASFDQRYLRKWEKLLADNEEPALAEARVRQILNSYGINVEPYESLTGEARRPDFRCCAGSRTFYVEVACIPIAVAARKTKIPNGPHGCAEFHTLTDAIFAKCRGKATQCKNLDAPVLVAIGTFHNFAAMSCFRKVWLNWVLTGKPRVAWEVGRETGTQTGETQQVTELQSAAFLAPDESEEIGYARSPISGLLLSGLTLGKRPFIGVLHPKPVRPFDPAILPEVEFGQLVIDRVSRQLTVDWPRDDDQ
jgi:hypothetical protein